MAMRLKASSGEARELVPPGSYKGILVGIYDIGTQESPFGPKHNIVLTWELHKRGLEKPLLISKFYGFSFSEKSTLRKDAEAMLGKTFSDGEELDLERLLETACAVSITHGKKKDGSPRDEIKSLMPLDEDVTLPEAVNDTCYFEITGMECAIPSEVPKWIRAKIEAAPEWTGHAENVRADGSNGAKGAMPDDDDFNDRF